MHSIQRILTRPLVLALALAAGCARSGFRDPSPNPNPGDAGQERAADAGGDLLRDGVAGETRLDGSCQQDGGGALPGVTVNYRSIGVAAGPLYLKGHASTHCGSRSVLFEGGASLPARVGRGDRLLIGGNELFILSRDSPVRATLQSPARRTLHRVAYSIWRAFSSLGAWHGARRGDLVAEDRREVGICYDDGPLVDPLMIFGSTTDARHYIELTVAKLHRHKGRAGTGVLLRPAIPWHGIQVLDDYTRIRWLEISGWSRGATKSYDGINIRADRVLVEGVMIHDDGVRDRPNPDCNGITLEADDKRATVRNSIIYHIARAGISIHKASNARLTVENSTIWACTENDGRPEGYGCVGVYDTQGSQITAMNVIAMGALNGGSDFFSHRTLSGFSASSRSNLSSDQSAPGGGSVHARTPASEFLRLSAAVDLHLRAGATAIDRGSDLSARFGLDVDGDVRPAGKAWDIGADER